MQFLPCLLGALDVEALDLDVRGPAPWSCSMGEAIWGLYGWHSSRVCPSFQGCSTGGHPRSGCFPRSLLWVASNQLGFREHGVETVCPHCVLFQFLTHRPLSLIHEWLFYATSLGCFVRLQRIPKQFSSNFFLFVKPSLLLPVLPTIPSPKLKRVILVSQSPLLYLYQRTDSSCLSADDELRAATLWVIFIFSEHLAQRPAHWIQRRVPLCLVLLV